MGRGRGVKRYSDVMAEYRVTLFQRLHSDKLSPEKYERLVDKTYEWEDRNDEQRR